MAPVTAPHVSGTLLAVGVPAVRPVGVAGGCVVPPPGPTRLTSSTT
ncbi:hypothetical protein M768_06050 [Cellulosimicrobium cellulans F16]|uniref:Uncharacterized protein n=1 Tax=Cellulosimicrobium cellulans F16 TaxID=1350482 RepID=A0A0M0FDG0_CELCE|nr:hypothetical protein M768_06050 [Cellulosimicrobium cellulans F16]